jgi:hypothetical protein
VNFRSKNNKKAVIAPETIDGIKNGTSFLVRRILAADE